MTGCQGYLVTVQVVLQLKLHFDIYSKCNFGEFILYLFKFSTQVHRLTSYIALFLLLLFCRVMVPDALLLELHPHTHTAHPEHTDAKHTQIGMKHKHCPVEDLFGAPYQPSFSSVSFTEAPQFTSYTSHFAANWQGRSLLYSQLRAPPVVWNFISSYTLKQQLQSLLPLAGVYFNFRLKLYPVFAS